MCSGQWAMSSLGSRTTLVSSSIAVRAVGISVEPRRGVQSGVARWALRSVSGQWAEDTVSLI